MGLGFQTQKLITEITSLEKEVTHLEQHVLNLYRKVVDQRLVPELQRNLHSEPSSPCSSHVERKHAMAASAAPGQSRFKLEKPLQQRAPRENVAAQGSKRPHSAMISNDLLRTRHSSLLGGTFSSIDEEPREMQDFSGEFPSVSTHKLCHINSFLAFWCQYVIISVFFVIIVLIIFYLCRSV